MIEQNEMLNTSVGIFEVDCYVGPTGTSIALDPESGRADLPEIIDVTSVADVAMALHTAGAPHDEAEALAPGLWDRRWRTPEHSGQISFACASVHEDTPSDTQPMKTMRDLGVTPEEQDTLARAVPLLRRLAQS